MIDAEPVTTKALSTLAGVTTGSISLELYGDSGALVTVAR